MFSVPTLGFPLIFFHQNIRKISIFFNWQPRHKTNGHTIAIQSLFYTRTRTKVSHPNKISLKLSRVGKVLNTKRTTVKQDVISSGRRSHLYYAFQLRNIAIYDCLRLLFWSIVQSPQVDICIEAPECQKYTPTPRCLGAGAASRASICSCSFSS